MRWFRKHTEDLPIKVDIHSHLLPGIDDGAQTMEESIVLIRAFAALGYRKLVTTPHIMSDIYRNTPEIINDKLQQVKAELEAQQIVIELEAAAEYYLDENLMAALQDDQPLLSFGQRYILFEANFLSEPLLLKEFIFLASTKGYKPVLAHPERYAWLQQNDEKISDLLERGVLFQLNISSLAGYYSRPVRQMARTLINRGQVHWLGSDCHQMHHIELIRSLTGSKYMKKALNLPLLNNTLQ